MKKNNNNSLIKSRWKSFKNPIFTFFVIAIPCLLLWIFFSNDFPFAKHYNLDYSWWIKLLIGISFIVGTFLITVLFVYIKILDLSIFIFSLPVSICFVVIFVSDGLEPWIRALIVIPFFLLVIPISIITKKIEIKKMIKKQQTSLNEEKIIGHK
ncbi:MAG: hypothetical protein HDR43_00315 [Mycoplasma sp.]|nr:hypothetical protein [Mycoplasma sp.]